jgi:hypothetical protein
MKAPQEEGHEFEHQSVDQEQKKTQRDDRDRQRQNDQDRSNDRVHDTQKQRRKEKGAPGIGRDAGDDSGRDPEPEGGDQCPQDETDHGSLLW